MIQQDTEPSFFWGSRFPLSSLAGIGLLVSASSRTAFALVCTGALVWVYGLSALAVRFLSPFFPKKGKTVILLFLTALFGSLFLLIWFSISPFLALETAFFIMLIPVVCTGSELYQRLRGGDASQLIMNVLLEALSLGWLVMALALIREPLGFGSLSLPGGPQGIIFIFHTGEGGFLSLGVISSSAGALFLLGYAVAFFRVYKKKREEGGV